MADKTLVESVAPIVCPDCEWEFLDQARYDSHLTDRSFIHTRVTSPERRTNHG